MSKIRSALSSIAVAAFVSLVGAEPAHAVLVIDPNFAVCPLGTTDATTCGLDPNPVSSAGVTVGVIGNAGDGPLNPFLLFVAVPTLPSPPLSGAPAPAPIPGVSGSLTIALATSAQYGQTNTPVNGYLGELTSSDIYTFAGVTDGNNSFSFVNMAGLAAEQTLLGTTPTSFSIYEFIVTVDSITGNLGTAPTVYDLPFTSLALGSYVAAYGIEANPAVDGTHVYDSAFTVGGFVNSSGPPPSSGPMPEPSTSALALLGLGLILLSFRARRKEGQ